MLKLRKGKKNIYTATSCAGMADAVWSQCSAFFFVTHLQSYIQLNVNNWNWMSMWNQTGSGSQQQCFHKNDLLPAGGPVDFACRSTFCAHNCIPTVGVLSRKWHNDHPCHFWTARHNSVIHGISAHRQGKGQGTVSCIHLTAPHHECLALHKHNLNQI